MVLQWDNHFEGGHRIFRAPIPAHEQPYQRKQKSAARSAYATLGVREDAGDEAIRDAYRTKAMALHPDTGGSEEQFKTLTRAYAEVSSQERRETYDALGPQVTH